MIATGKKETPVDKTLEDLKDSMNFFRLLLKYKKMLALKKRRVEALNAFAIKIRAIVRAPGFKDLDQDERLKQILEA